MSSLRSIALIFAFALSVSIPKTHAQAQHPAAPPCPRFEAGSIVQNPPSLYSQNGVLTVDLAYRSRTDADGRTLYCYTTLDGQESPTLHAHPGDTVILNVVNEVAAPASSPEMEMSMSTPSACGPSTRMNAASMNMHFHGTNLPPVCHQDEVISTIINTGEHFRYELHFPKDEPAGLYWYHPHIHGMAELTTQGGASGALIIEGIENLQPEVAGLRERVLMIRDQTVAGNPNPGGKIPSWDLTLNYVPIAYPRLTPSILHMLPGEKQLWRVANASADSLVNLQVVYDGVPQTLKIVALDGVPTGSQDGTRQGKIVETTQILIPTAGRAEFIVSPPGPKTQHAILRTLGVPTGPAGDNDTQRTLAKIELSHVADDADFIPADSQVPGRQRFEGLETAQVTQESKLYFCEVISNPKDPLSPTNFYITVDGAKPRIFSPENPPAIVTKQDSVEEWTVENRAQENHEFHIHQIHFLLEARNGVAVPADQQQFLG